VFGLDAELFDLLFYIIDEFVAADAVRKAGIVGDIRRQGQLAAQFVALKNEQVIVRLINGDGRSQHRDIRAGDD